MTTRPRDPFTDTDRLLVDGTNLLHAMSRTAGAAPPAALIGTLRAMVPAAVGIELVLDGTPDRGMRGERVAAGLIVRHAGKRSADDVLLGLVEEARGAVGAAGTSRLLVVTDDRALRGRVQSIGARTAGTGWLIGRLSRPALAAPSVGNKRPPKPAGPPSTAGSGGPGDGHGDGEDAAPGWRPGRGATTKRGNPRRRRASSGRMPR